MIVELAGGLALDVGDEGLVLLGQLLCDVLVVAYLMGHCLAIYRELHPSLVQPLGLPEHLGGAKEVTLLAPWSELNSGHVILFSFRNDQVARRSLITRGNIIETGRARLHLAG